MIVQCQKCLRWYDDEFTWTICPHGPLWAPLDAYCRMHDLVNCFICNPTEPADERRDAGDPEGT